MSLRHSIPKSIKKSAAWPWCEPDMPSISMVSQPNPWLSIIIPTYNQGQYIEEAIRSILSQGISGIEIIVMDGGSSDETVEILKHYDDHLIWRSEKDRGQSHAMNKGLKLASGHLLGFLNSDDYYEKGALKSIFRAYGKNQSEPSIYLGKTRLIKASGEEIRINVPCTNFHQLAQPGHRFKMPNNPSGYFYHKSLHDVIGGFDEEDHYTMDYDFLLKGFRAAKSIKYVDEIWGNYRYDVHAKTYQQEQNGEGGIEKLKNKQRLALEQAGFFGEKYVQLLRRAHKLYALRLKLTGPRFMRWLSDPIAQFSRLTIDKQLASLEKQRSK